MNNLNELLGASMAVTLRVALEQASEETERMIRNSFADLNVSDAEKRRIVKTFKASMDTRLSGIIKDLDGEDE